MQLSIRKILKFPEELARTHTPEEEAELQSLAKEMYDKCEPLGLLPDLMIELSKRAIEENVEVIKKFRHLKENILRIKGRSEKREISIDGRFLYELGKRQDWKCALTGVPLEFTRGGQEWDGKWANPNSCSVDRIDSSLGYISGNIQLVTWRANKAKGSMANQEFIDMCQNVAGNQ